MATAPKIQVNGVTESGSTAKLAQQKQPPAPPAPPSQPPPPPVAAPAAAAAAAAAEDVEAADRQPAEPLPNDCCSRCSRFFMSVLRRIGAGFLGFPGAMRRFFWFLVYYVFDTSSTAYYIWIGITACAATYDLTLIIARSVFTDLQEQYIQLWFGLDYSADAIYLIDMFVKSRTGFLEQGLLIRDLKLLAKNYIKSVGFAVDVVSVLPTDFIYLALSTDYVIVRINRLFRITRISEFLTKTEARVPSPNAFRIAILLTYILMIIHWNGCMYYAISKFVGLNSGDPWIYQGNETDPILDKYVYCYWWATVVLTNIAEIPHPVTEFETFIQVANFLIGLLIFASLVGKVGTMITSMNAAQNEFQFRLDSVKQYMKFRKVSPELQNKVLKWFDYIWMNRQMSNEDKVLRLLPEKLRAEIAIHVHLETLKRVKLFQDSEIGLLVELVLKLRLQVFSPGDYICRKGDIGKEMYICKSGKLEVVADDGEKVFATLSDGSVFGEISLLSIPGNKTGNRRTANVRSKGYSDLFVLSKEDLHSAMREYPDAMQKLIEKGTEMLRKEGKIDEELAAKHIGAEMRIEQKFSLLESHLDKLQSRVSQLLGDFNNSDRTLKQRLTRMEYALTNTTAQQFATGTGVGGGGGGGGTTTVQVQVPVQQQQQQQQQQQPPSLPGQLQHQTSVEKQAATKLVRIASIGGVGTEGDDSSDTSHQQPQHVVARVQHHHQEQHQQQGEHQHQHQHQHSSHPHQHPHQPQQEHHQKSTPPRKHKQPPPPS